MYRVFSCVVGRGCLLLPVCLFSRQNSVSLWPALFYTLKPNLPVTLGSSWLPTFAFQSPIMKRTSLWGVSSKRSCRSYRTIQLQLLQHYWLGHRFGLLWYWMVCLGKWFSGKWFSGKWFALGMVCREMKPWKWFASKMNIFEIASKYGILHSFIDCDGYSTSSKVLSK